MMMWKRQGYLKTTEGNVVHYGFIENFIDELGQKFHIKEIAFDRWGAVQMSQNLEGLGFTMVQFGQGYKDMSPPTKGIDETDLGTDACPQWTSCFEVDDGQHLHSP